MSHQEHHVKDNLAGRVLQHTEVNVDRCYQCGKCSAGCPVANEMDFPPSVIMRLLQTENPEYEELVLSSKTIWLCLTCETCISRCPMEVDIPPLMDFLRSESLRLKKVNPCAKNIIAFHNAFLNTIKKNGRLHEIGLIKDYKLKTFNLLQDVALAPKMMAKGKLSLKAEKIKDRKSVQMIFSRTLT